MSAPTIWEAISEVNIADYATNYLGYSLHNPRANIQAGEKMGSSIRLTSGYGDIWAGVTRGGENMWNSFSGNESGNIISLIKRDLNLSGADLAEEVKTILNNYSIPYYDEMEERNGNQQARRIEPSEEQKRVFAEKKAQKAKELEQLEKENREIFLKTYRAIQRYEILYVPPNGKELRGIPADYWEMMGNKTRPALKAHPEYPYLSGNCIHTKSRGRDGTEYNQLNFILRNIKLEVIGIAKKNGETGKDEEKAVVRGSKKGYSILGNIKSRNIVITESPIDAISFNIAKNISFENVVHLSSMGGLPSQRLDEMEQILKKRIKNNQPTTLYLAFDNDKYGDKYMETFENRFRGLLNKADPEGKTFKMVDARCPSQYSDYNDFIRGIKKDDGGEGNENTIEKDDGKTKKKKRPIKP